MNLPALPLRAGLLLGALACATLANAAPPPREQFLAAKHTAIEANYHNDQNGLRAAIAGFTALESDADLGARALYHAAWTEWMMAASQIQDKQLADATATLDSGIGRLNKVLEAHPDDGEVHTLLTWMTMASSFTDSTRFQANVPKVRQHRERALALVPHSPRAVMLDGTLLFYSRQPGEQEKGIERWLETLRLLDAEKIADPTLPDWGRTLADGWLANLYLFTKPARVAEAREHALKALRERPDFWYVKTQVLPRTEPKPPEAQSGATQPASTNTELSRN